MKHLNKLYIRIAVLSIISVCICISFYFLMKNGAESLLAIKDHAVNTMLPFIYGLSLAYILNPIMVVTENRLIVPLFERFPKWKDKKSLIRGISVFITIIIFFIIITGLIVLIVPQLIDSIQSMILRTPSYVSRLNKLVSDLLKNNPEFEELFSTYSEQFSRYLNSELLPSIQSMVSSVSGTIFSSVFGIFYNLFKFIIGIIICIYLLFKKETYLAQCKKIVYAFFPTDRANDIINNGRFANRTFGGFLSGKLFDSLIIGIICFICTSIMKMPYALLISCFIGVTNIIPFFGPFIGAIPSAIIILIISPMKALIFVAFIFILQQFDGNVLGPKILGDSTGLPSFWVIFAITLFGGIFGVLGMFIGVPIFSIIYAVFKAYIESKLKNKEMPSETAFYVESDYYPGGESGAGKPEMSGEQFRLKDGTVSEKIPNPRYNKGKTAPEGNGKGKNGKNPK